MFTNLSSKEFKNSLLNIAKSLVWKDFHLATKYEIDEFYFNVDKYLSGIRLLMTKYSPEYIKRYISMTHEEFYGNSSLGKSGAIDLITPESMNVSMRQVYEYEEHNDYYRMLNGLPPYYGTGSYVYSNLNVSSNVDKKVPVHEWSILDKETFLRSDEYRVLKENDVEGKYKYLDFMTFRRIEPFIARNARRFDILYIAESEIDILTKDFKSIYATASDYVIYLYYSDAYRGDEGIHYENFIAMSILLMTLNRMCVKYLEADISRDFYDLDSLKVVYSAYGVPFIEEIPIKYHKIIVKKINKLISYKGSNQVFIDLASIFNYDVLSIFQYYLFKARKFDANDNPITLYTEQRDRTGNIVYDEYGVPIMVPDYENMYDIYFLKSNLNTDPYLEILDPENYIDYEGVVTADRYWLEDDYDTKKAVYETTYNYIETKYIGVQMMFNLSEVLYESSYYLKALFDSKDSTKNIAINHSIMAIDIPLFDMVLYTFALICKKRGFAGNIPSEPSKIARVYGFNFKGIINKLKETSLQGFQIRKDYGPGDTFNPMNIALGNDFFHGNDIQEWMPFVEYLQTSTEGRNAYTELLDGFNKMIFTDKESVDIVYKSLRNMMDLVDNMLIVSKDKNEYSAYSELKRILFTTELIEELYTKSDGQVAKTYEELLGDVNGELYIRMQTLEDLDNELDFCLVALDKLAEDVDNLQYTAGNDVSIIADYLYSLLRFFKSAKADLIDFNILTKIDNRTDNMIKIVDHVFNATHTTEVEDKFEYLQDLVRKTKNGGTPKDRLKLSDRLIKY